MLDILQIMCFNDFVKVKGGVRMKKNARYITGLLDLLIIISAFVLPMWSCSAYSYYYGSMNTDTTTIKLLNESMYNEEILHFCLLGSFLILFVSAVLSLTNKSLNVTRWTQFIASIIVAIMYFSIHIEIFSLIADITCELNFLGLVVVVICIANAVISFTCLKNNEEHKKENENVL